MKTDQLEDNNKHQTILCTFDLKYRHLKFSQDKNENYIYKVTVQNGNDHSEQYSQIIDFSLNFEDQRQNQTRRSMQMKHIYEKKMNIMIELISKEQNKTIAVGYISMKRMVIKKDSIVQLLSESKQKYAEIGIKCQKKQAIYDIQFSLDCSEVDMNQSSCFCVGQSNLLYLTIQSSDMAQKQNPIFKNGLKRNKIFSNLKLQSIKEKSNFQLTFNLFKNSKYTNLVGSGTINIEALMEQKQIKLDLEQDKQRVCSITINQISKIGINDQSSLIAYLRTGIQVQMVVAIDFSKSNQASKLHTYDQKGHTQYLDAIQQVCEIVIDVDTDKKVPVYGFGGTFGEKTNDKPYLFALNGDFKNPDVDGVKGIKTIYQNALKSIQFDGPAKYCPLLKHIMKECQIKKKNMNAYTILLIFVDGLLDDYQETKQLINKCVRLPLSIVITGIGKGDLTKDNQGWRIMQEFDNQMHNKRDLIKFVYYDKFRDREKMRFGQIVLQEFPRQFIEYQKLMNYTPKDYRQRFSASKEEKIKSKN